MIFIDPWSKTKSTIATGVRLPQLTKRRSGRSRTGKVVVRDPSLQVVGTFGTAVTELRTVSNDAPRAAYIDGGDLYVITDQLETPEKVASDACQVAFPGGWAGRGIAYFSPCADRRLVVYGSPSVPSDPADDKTYVVGDSALGKPAAAPVAIPTVDFSTGRGMIFYVKNADPAATNGELWGGPIGGTLEHIGDNPVIDGNKTPSVTAVLRSLANDLERRSTDEPSRNVETGCTAPGRSSTMSPFRISSRTSLRSRSRTQQATRATSFAFTGRARRRPLSRSPAQRRRRCFVVHRTAVRRWGVGRTSPCSRTRPPSRCRTARTKPRSGQLLVAGNPDGPYEPVAADVQAGTFGFIQNLHAVAYLHDYDAALGVGTLGVRVVDTADDTFDLGLKASSWKEIGWPQPGLLVRGAGREPARNLVRPPALAAAASPKPLSWPKIRGPRHEHDLSPSPTGQ